MPLEIKVGHRYRTRSGDVVEITGKGYSKIFPFLGTSISTGSVYSFTPGGGWLEGDATEDDLMFEELPGDVDLLTKK